MQTNEMPGNLIMKFTPLCWCSDSALFHYYATIKQLFTFKTVNMQMCMIFSVWVSWNATVFSAQISSMRLGRMTAIKNQSFMQSNAFACLFARPVRCLLDVLAAIFSSAPNYGPFRQHCCRPAWRE